MPIAGAAGIDQDNVATLSQVRQRGILREFRVRFTGTAGKKENGRFCRIRKAIIEANVEIPEGTEIGINPEEDRTRGYTISEGGVTVV